MVQIQLCHLGQVFSNSCISLPVVHASLTPVSTAVTCEQRIERGIYLKSEQHAEQVWTLATALVSDVSSPQVSQ